jgi:hypothetical protein
MSTLDGQVATAYLAEARRQFQYIAGRVHHAVEQLDDAQIWWRAAEEFNSAGNLLLHLIGNITERILDLVGGQTHQRDRDREFAHRDVIPKAELLARFDATLTAVDEVLATLPPEQLLETRRYHMLTGDVELTRLGIILQNLVHVSGHTQEIIALARQQLRDRYRFQLTAKPVR